MTLAELYVYVRDGGTLAVLLLIIVGGMRGWYIWKREADEYRDRIRALEDKLDRAERLAVGGTALARRAVAHAERTGPTGDDDA